ncbi:MAG: EAL domain-containing protein [Rhodospirillales bacterium]|nr:EAL domain-containing protein [Rhodospirillales bacterium]
MGGFYLPGLLLWVSQFSVSLVALAAMLCLTGSYTVMIVLRRAKAMRAGRRASWFLALCLCFGANVWATHFIAMLAFDPGIPIYYDTTRTALSILVAVLGALPAFALLLWCPAMRLAWAVAGVVLGAAIGAMHFIGMSAMMLCGSFGYNPVSVVVSLAWGMAVAAFSMWVMQRTAGRGAFRASLLLASAICGLHFIAMGGLVITPHSHWLFSPFITGKGKADLAAAVAAVSMLLLITLLISATTDAKLVERQIEAKRLWHLARHDDLTGLLNRRGLRERLSEMTSEPLVLISIGLVRLKPVDDLFGREVVDKLFCQAAARLAAQLQLADILAMPAGEEFVVLRAIVDVAGEPLAFAQRLIDCLSEPFKIDGVTVQIGACAGLVFSEGSGEGAESLLSAADIALREAKAAGAGQARHFTMAMSARLLRRHQLEQEFEAALRNREFMLFFQPLFDCRSLTLRGFEALARWQHPERGMIGPDEFIPVAEAGGMITALGEYVLEEACRAASTWPEELRVAVNLSPVQLKSPALPEKIWAALARNGLAPQRLELELTEGAMLEQTAEVQLSLAALKDSGVSFAIDDFGAGYSSLSYLHRFSFERLKIDKSFTREITASPDARIVTGAIIGLGAALGMAVLAEGVETEAQLNILRKAGCGQVQGFLLGKPMPEQDVQTLLTQVAKAGGRAVPVLS